MTRVLSGSRESCLGQTEARFSNCAGAFGGRNSSAFATAKASLATVRGPELDTCIIDRPDLAPAEKRQDVTVQSCAVTAPARRSEPARRIPPGRPATSPNRLYFAGALLEAAHPPHKAEYLRLDRVLQRNAHAIKPILAFQRCERTLGVGGTRAPGPHRGCKARSVRLVSRCRSRSQH